MGTVTTSLKREAETIFRNLGYTVSWEANELRAERKWRVVQVSLMSETETLPSDGTYRCFVTEEDNLSALERKLRDENPEYEWAIIGISEDEEYVVSRY